MVYLSVNVHAGAVGHRPAPSLDQVVEDLRATQSNLRDVLLDLAPEEWDRATPSPGWSVRHQVRHLAHGDELAALAASDPAGFADELERLLGDLTAVEAATTATTGEPDPELVARWWAAAERMRSAVLAGPADERLSWVSGPMARASFVTARVMEAFAHGHDIGVAVGRAMGADRALPHVAHLGRSTRDFTYLNRDLAPPTTRLRLELTGESGEPVVLGPGDAEDVVRGPALDLCLVVTRRIHRLDAALIASGPHAEEWLGMAQCFVGPPSEGPPATSG